MSMSPKKRTRLATALPNSARNTCSMSEVSTGRVIESVLALGLVLERPDLNRRLAGNGGFRSPFQGGVEIGGLDDPESPQLLLGLGERPVGGDDLAILFPHNCGGGRPLQAAAE